MSVMFHLQYFTDLTVKSHLNVFFQELLPLKCLRRKKVLMQSVNLQNSLMRSEQSYYPKGAVSHQNTLLNATNFALGKKIINTKQNRTSSWG